MIIGKIGRACVWVLLLCLLLSGCQKERAPEIPLELLRENLPSEESEQAKQYCVVIPDDSSACVWETAQGLAHKLTQQIGKEIEFVYEHKAPSAQKEMFFLFVGWLRSVDVSDRLMKNLKKDDYLCRSVEQGICLGGKTDEATRTAVDRFCEEILPAATASSLMHPDGGFSYVGDAYSVESVRLNGFDLHTYCVVYPNDSSAQLLELVYAMRDEIADVSGYWLDVRAEKNIGEQEKGIWIGTASPPQAGMSAYLLPIEQGILLTGWDFFGISVAARSFCSLLLREGETQIGINVIEIQAFSYGQTEHTLLSIAPEGVFPFSSLAEVQALADRIHGDGPDAVFCGAIPIDQANYLTGSLGGYASVTGAIDSLWDILAYAKGDTVSLIETHASENASWVVSSFWVGSRWNGFQVVQISGTLTEDEEWSISELELDWEAPTLFLIHTRISGGSFSLSDMEKCGASLVLSEQYAVSDDLYFFACYATVSELRVQMGDLPSGIYRTMSVDRLSAF